MPLTLINASTAPLPDVTPVLREYNLTGVAAGSDFSINVPAGEIWRVLALRCILNASAAVANRLPRILVWPFGTLVYQTPSAVTVVATDVVSLNIAANVQPASDSAKITAQPIPDVLLPPASVVSSSTANLQAGDQWNGIVLYTYVYT